MIEYNFHEIDFQLWKELLELHKENVLDPILYEKNMIITDVRDTETGSSEKDFGEEELWQLFLGMI